MITEGEGGKKSQNFVWLAGPVENTLNNHFWTLEVIFFCIGLQRFIFFCYLKIYIMPLSTKNYRILFSNINSIE